VRWDFLWIVRIFDKSTTLKINYTMKYLKLIVLSFFTTLILLSCGTAHNYSNKGLNKTFYEGKTLYFTLDPESKKEITLSGLHGNILGPYMPPNVEETFKLALKELTAETGISLQYLNRSDANSDTNPLIFDTNISEISWHFGFSVATLKTVTNFKNLSTAKELQTTGIRKSGGGDEMNNLKKSLKDATFNFLKVYEQQ
jgi:hypothetical protein